MKTTYEYLHPLTRIFCDYLNTRLPKLGGANWWNVVVLNNLTPHQQKICRQHGYRTLADLDLPCLLRVFQGNFNALHQMDGFPREARSYFFELADIRNRSVHAGSNGLKTWDLLRDLDTILRVLETLGHDGAVYREVCEARRQAARAVAAEEKRALLTLREDSVRRPIATTFPVAVPSTRVGDAVSNGLHDRRTGDADRAAA